MGRGSTRCYHTWRYFVNHTKIIYIFKHFITLHSKFENENCQCSRDKTTSKNTLFLASLIQSPRFGIIHLCNIPTRFLWFCYLEQKWFSSESISTATSGIFGKNVCWKTGFNSHLIIGATFLRPVSHKSKTCKMCYWNYGVLPRDKTVVGATTSTQTWLDKYWDWKQFYLNTKPEKKLSYSRINLM